jgi:hypothetical protein
MLWLLPAVVTLAALLPLIAAVRAATAETRRARYAVVEVRDDMRRLRDAWGRAGHQ